MALRAWLDQLQAHWDDQLRSFKIHVEQTAMIQPQTVSSEVDVAVDPITAFTVFTEEMDLWWVRGPINFRLDGGRVVEVRCESGVGGRIIEVLDDRNGPRRSWNGLASRCGSRGARLAWASSLDDVQTEVSFVPVDGGTRVTVEHVVPEGGEDKGGTAWSRVVPRWFGAWCAGRGPRATRADRHRPAVARHLLRATGGGRHDGSPRCSRFESAR